jgi:HEPN domain-containing protein
MPYVRNKRTGEVIEVDASGRPVGASQGGVFTLPPDPQTVRANERQDRTEARITENDAERLRIAQQQLKLQEEAAARDAAIKQREMEYTPAQKSADEAFGKEYTDWNAGGGFSAVDSQLKLLEGQVPRLENSDTISGGIVGRLPDFVRQAINEDSISTQQNVEKSIQATLRQTLGAQYTAQEGENLLRRTYDPRLSEEENAARIRATVEELRARANAKNDSAGYYERNGTIRGWTPPPKNAPTSDYAREMAKQREKFIREYKGYGDPAAIWRSVAEPAGRASLERRLKTPPPRKKSGGARFLGWED